ncbi:hypothetical protein LJ707_04355 [Mucilaginibacter sp. UR6-1]|uniref:hypothetical protein n=1 Tax=Mucilaginibacter sp. UR6-1 TaxID=1435643 RepID=UPI001E38C83E|nr:hypothetical protein [Mucilaginibacter sp. UR6-1]MCC8408149.1 hypothetical protein [Mucilaginibacter sp. UR6-1]
MKNLTTTINRFGLRVMNNEMNGFDVAIIVTICLSFSAGTIFLIGDPSLLAK